MHAKLEKETELGLYRIIQEVTGNALKHANPGLIKVSLTQQENLLRLVVSDNGTGFDYEEVSNLKTSSMGLSGIKARASLINGKLAISSSKQTGTRIELTIPVNYNQKYL